MIWNYTDKAELTMKNFSEEDLKNYLSKISDEAYMLIMFIKLRVREEIYFQILMEMKDTIMGLTSLKIKEYLKNYNEKIFSYRKSY